MKSLMLFFLIGLISCNNDKKPAFIASPPGYDLQDPTTIKLPLELDEISGLSYYKKDKSVFAISDEKGVLFKITPYPALSIKVWKFSKKADFEDLALLDSTFYILQSNGTMHIVNFLKEDTISTTEIPFPFKGSMEFETLFYDPVIKKLELICKTCEDAKKKLLNTYIYDPAKNAYEDSVVGIDIGLMFKNSGEKPFHVKASAAAVHPITGDVYVISSINKLLIILDKNHNFKSYYPLNPTLFKQPEGIAFSENGTLIISNESAGAGPANLLLFNYQK
jgi:SdiA-regulated